MHQDPAATPWPAIASAVREATGADFEIDRIHAVRGGCINETFRITDGDRNYFVKRHDAGRLPMFTAESEGLAEIGSTQSIRVPRPVCSGVDANHSFLVMEHISFGRRDNPVELGNRLAAMHRHTRPTHGWRLDNTIGSTPQINTPNAEWTAFWREHRLGYQLGLARRNGYGGVLTQRGDRLLEAFPALFATYAPEPSLLHGDLWSGNAGTDDLGNPVLFDPAVYYGDRETDLAMTELFGGFGPRFHAAYRDAYPVDDGYPVRKIFYNLYHVLNHLNLFGGGYGRQAERMMAELLSELGH